MGVDSEHRHEVALEFVGHHMRRTEDSGRVGGSMGELPVVRLLTHGLPHFAWLAVLPAAGQGQLLPAHPVMHTHASHGWRYVVMATRGWLLQHEAVTKLSCSLEFDEATPHTHSVEKGKRG